MTSIFADRWEVALFRLLKWLVVIFVGAAAVAMLSVVYVLVHTPEPLVVAQHSNRIIITNINIIDTDTGTLLPEKNLLIENGLIREISDTITPQEASTLLIDGSDKYLMPGLIDMHTHIADRQDLLLALAHGVTHTRDMNGVRMHLVMREEVNAGDTVGPDLTVASKAFNQPSNMGSGFLEEVITSPEHARKMVNYYRNQGYDLIKLYDSLRPDVFTAIVDESRKLNFPIAGHPSHFVDFDEYLLSGAQTLEHVEMLYQVPLGYQRNRESLVLLLTALLKAQIPINATIANFDQLARIAAQKQDYIDTIPLHYMNPLLRRLNAPGINYVKQIESSEQWVEKSQYLGEISKALYETGVPVVLGSDAGAGYTLNGIGLIEEMQLLNSHNISTTEILHSGTVAGAKALNLEGVIGGVVVGMKANLIITAQDPRVDLGTFYHLEGVLKNSVYYSRESIVAMKNKAKGHMPYFELLGWVLLGS